MTDDAAPEVVSILEDDTGARRVEVIRRGQAHFTFVEFHLDEAAAGDDEVWQEVVAEAPKSYPSEYAAYSAALRGVDWLLD